MLIKGKNLVPWLICFLANLLIKKRTLTYMLLQNFLDSPHARSFRGLAVCVIVVGITDLIDVWMRETRTGRIWHVVSVVMDLLVFIFVCNCDFSATWSQNSLLAINITSSGLSKSSFGAGLDGKQCKIANDFKVHKPFFDIYNEQKTVYFLSRRSPGVSKMIEKTTRQSLEGCVTCNERTRCDMHFHKSQHHQKGWKDDIRALHKSNYLHKHYNLNEEVRAVPFYEADLIQNGDIDRVISLHAQDMEDRMEQLNYTAEFLNIQNYLSMPHSVMPIRDTPQDEQNNVVTDCDRGTREQETRAAVQNDSLHGSDGDYSDIESWTNSSDSYVIENASGMLEHTLTTDRKSFSYAEISSDSYEEQSTDIQANGEQNQHIDHARERRLEDDGQPNHFSRCVTACHQLNYQDESGLTGHNSNSDNDTEPLISNLPPVDGQGSRMRQPHDNKSNMEPNSTIGSSRQYSFVNNSSVSFYPSFPSTQRTVEMYPPSNSLYERNGTTGECTTTKQNAVSTNGQSNVCDDRQQSYVRQLVQAKHANTSSSNENQNADRSCRQRQRSLSFCSTSTRDISYDKARPSYHRTMSFNRSKDLQQHINEVNVLPNSGPYRIKNSCWHSYNTQNIYSNADHVSVQETITGNIHNEDTTSPVISLRNTRRLDITTRIPFPPVGKEENHNQYHIINTLIGTFLVLTSGLGLQQRSESTQEYHERRSDQHHRRHRNNRQSSSDDRLSRINPGKESDENSVTCEWDQTQGPRQVQLTPRQCRKCRESPAVSFVPCNHEVYCVTCGQTISTCPICGQ